MNFISNCLIYMYSSDINVRMCSYFLGIGFSVAQASLGSYVDFQLFTDGRRSLFIRLNYTCYVLVGRTINVPQVNWAAFIRVTDGVRTDVVKTFRTRQSLTATDRIRTPVFNLQQTDKRQYILYFLFYSYNCMYISLTIDSLTITRQRIPR